MTAVRLYGLVDCNSFFVSCEKLFRPDLANKPVVVLSNNDGVVVSRSPEAKQLGIPMGEPYFKIKRLAESGRVKVFSSNYRLYGDLSRKHDDVGARDLFSACAVPRLGFFTCMVNGRLFPCAKARLLYESNIVDVSLNAFATSGLAGSIAERRS